MKRSILVCTVALAAGVAAGDVTFDRKVFEHMFPDLNLEDFEGIVKDDGAVQNPDLHRLTIKSNADGGKGWGVAGKDYLDTPSAVAWAFFADDSLILTFDDPTLVVGMNLTNADFFNPGWSGNIGVDVYDMGGALVESLEFATSPPGTMKTFIGVYGRWDGIGKVVVRDVAGFAGTPFIDDVQWGAPEEEECYPDFTRDGALDLFDFLAFVNTFNAQKPQADCDGNGALELFDFLCFVNEFNAGC